MRWILIFSKANSSHILTNFIRIVLQVLKICPNIHIFVKVWFISSFFSKLSMRQEGYKLICSLKDLVLSSSNSKCLKIRKILSSIIQLGAFIILFPNSFHEKHFQLNQHLKRDYTYSLVIFHKLDFRLLGLGFFLEKFL